ncbi:MAG TPA: hypothetical protein VNU71_13475 [Burkholderiaceae bacterium]|nr:hypothetical protein [Burkholderiaceae bacterium]
MATSPRPPKPVELSNAEAIAVVNELIAPQLKPDPKSVRDELGKTIGERHEQRRGWFLAEAGRQAANRARMAKCEQYYDSVQIPHDEALKLEDRGQKPVVYNEIFYVINWLIGTERRNRVDFYVMADGDAPEDDDDATNKTKLLKYLDECNRAAFERSYAAEEAFKAGMGWIEVGLRGDDSGIPVSISAESWRNMLWDSKAMKRDLSDARYFFRMKTLDLDVALAMFPDKKAELEAASQTGDALTMFGGWTGINNLSGVGIDSFQNGDQSERYAGDVVDVFNPRERVMLLECWSREPVKRQAKDGEGLSDPIRFRMRVSIMTELDTLIEAWSPFKNDNAPFIPVWGYRNSTTRLPYSLIWPLIGPQDSLNHRMSKSLYEASANQMELERGAIDPTEGGMTLDDLHAEWNDPSGVAIYANGALTNNKVRKRDNAGAAAQQLALAERDISTIRHMSGIDAAAQGLRSNLNSGVALKTNNENTSLLTAELMDNLLLGRQLEGEMALSLCEQFIVGPINVRLPGEGGGRGERVKLNDPQPDGTYLNDITVRKANFVVGEQAWKQSYAEAAFDQLMQVLTQLAGPAPQVVVSLLDVIFEMHPNLPRKKAILARIRSVNGQSDPDGKMTPEQQQAKAQQAAMAKAKYEAEMGKLTAEIKKARSHGLKLDADAVLTKVTALYEAAQAAAVLAASPALSPIADAILSSADFIDGAGSPNTLGPAGMAPQQAQPLGMAAAAAPAEAAQQAQAAGAPPELQQTDGAAAGIETARPDGAVTQGAQQ